MIDIESTHPQIPTQFDTNAGSAIPLANIIEILGAGGITTSGSGNTVTIDGSGISPSFTITGDSGGAISPIADNWNLLSSVASAGSDPISVIGTPGTLTITTQYAQAIAASDANKVGLASFSSSAFDVDANGFVQLNGGGVATTSINVDANTAPGTDPVLPDGSGQITITGGQVAAGTVGANVIRTDSLSANAITLEIQRSTTNGTSDSTKNGVAHFDSAAFDVDANGWVQLNGGGIASTSFDVQANTAPGTDPVVPTALGVVTVNGAAVANHSVVLETRSRAANAYNIEVQYGAAVAATDATKSGVVHFDSSDFSVDANGFVTINTSGSVQGIIGTANQVLANGTSGSTQTGTVTLTTPQDIATTSSVAFGNVTLQTGGALRTSTSAGNTLLLQGYDTDTGPAYTTFGTITAGTTPTCIFTVSDGTVSAPAYSFLNNTDMGIYRSGANTMRISNGGTAIMSFATVSVSVLSRNFNIPSGFTHQLLGGLIFTRTATAISYTTLATDYIIAVTSTAAARTITLLTPSGGNGQIFIVKDESGGAATNNITVVGQGGKTIDGAASYLITSNYGSATFYYDGTNWGVI